MHLVAGVAVGVALGCILLVVWKHIARKVRNAKARTLANRSWKEVEAAVRKTGWNGRALFWNGEEFTFRRGDWGLDEIGMLLGSILHNVPLVQTPHFEAAKYLVGTFTPDEAGHIVKVISRRHWNDADELRIWLEMLFTEKTTADQSAVK